MVKATFSLDEATVEQIRKTAARRRQAQSHVVREAVADYAARSDRQRVRAIVPILAKRYARPRQRASPKRAADPKGVP